jgi:hypothetical protein
MQKMKIAHHRDTEEHGEKQKTIIKSWDVQVHTADMF